MVLRISINNGTKGNTTFLFQQDVNPALAISFKGKIFYTNKTDDLILFITIKANETKNILFRGERITNTYTDLKKVAEIKNLFLQTRSSERIYIILN